MTDLNEATDIVWSKVPNPAAVVAPNRTILLMSMDGEDSDFIRQWARYNVHSEHIHRIPVDVDNLTILVDRDHAKTRVDFPNQLAQGLVSDYRAIGGEPINGAAIITGTTDNGDLTGLNHGQLKYLLYRGAARKAHVLAVS